MFNIQEMFTDVCGKVGKDMFRMAMDGTLAVKTEKGYKAYDPKNKRMTKVGEFAIPDTSDMFFVMPVRKLTEGDIIIIDNQPVCVIEQHGEEVKFLTYEKSVIETRMVENIVFFGKPIYGKVVSLFSCMFKQADGNEDSMLKMMLMSQLFGGGANPFAAMFGGAAQYGSTNAGQGNMFQQMMPMMLMSQMFGGKKGSDDGGLFGNMFSGLFGGDEEEEKPAKKAE